MAARGESPVASLTMMTALLDFEDPGMLDVCSSTNIRCVSASKRSARVG